MTTDPWPHTYDLGYKDATTGEPISDQQAGEPFHDRRGITGMTRDECKRHLYDAVAAWLSASDLDDLNLPRGLTDAAEARWEAAKGEVVAELFKRGQR